MNTQEKHGDTPLDEADGETADLLRKHGGKTKKELQAQGKWGNSFHLELVIKMEKKLEDRPLCVDNSLS